MTTDQVIQVAVAEFDKAINHLKDEFGRLQIGRANPSLVENIPVEIYGSTQPIKAVATITVPDPRTLSIQPWDKSALTPIEKAIVGIGIGLNPVNDGNFVRINIPPLTQERRADLTKLVRKLAEETRITIRTSRQTAHNAFKNMKANEEITEDDLHGSDKRLQDRVDEFNKKVDELAQKKEQDIMTV